MAITQVVAGAYTATYNAQDQVYTQQGYEISIDSHGELINETDLYGESVIDIVNRGSSCRVSYESKVYDTTKTIPAFYPWGSLGVIATTAAPIGRLGTNVAASLVLTAVANTPAAAKPATLTATKSILAPGANLSLLFNSKARNVPVSLMCLPSESGGTVTYFTTT